LGLLDCAVLAPFFDRLLAARVVKEDIIRRDRRQHLLANYFCQILTDAQLNTYIATYLGEGAVAALENEARNANADVKALQTLALAQNERAEQLARSHKRTR
jgi:hypothetical protein